jgi:dienelactone hydrolase
MKQTKPFFSRGFGSPDTLRQLQQLRTTRSLQAELLQCKPHIEWRPDIETVGDGVSVQTLSFESPVQRLLPAESRIATALLVTPKQAKSTSSSVPLVALMPPTADFTYAARLRILAVPLAHRGIASLVPMIPFYAERKPAEQFRACLMSVSDLFALGAGVIGETSALFNVLAAATAGGAHRFHAFGISGYSLGGYLAAQFACVSDRELACVPIVLPRSATSVFTRGVLSRIVDFAGGLRSDVIDPRRRQLILDAVDLREADFTIPRSLFERQAEPGVFDRFFQNSFSPAMRNWLSALPFLNSAPRVPDEEIRETMYFFANFLEHMTNLASFSSPLRPDAMIKVIAKHDQYVPRDESLDACWPGSTVHYLDSGHVSTLFYQGMVVDTIAESFRLLQRRK